MRLRCAVWSWRWKYCSLDRTKMFYQQTSSPLDAGEAHVLVAGASNPVPRLELGRAAWTLDGCGSAV